MPFREMESANTSKTTEQSAIDQLNLSAYNYKLPEDRIAQYPLEKRDEARMLVYRQGQISHNRFYHLPDSLPANSLLFFNDTRVFHARLLFQKESGANLEVFCLEPVEKHREINLVMWDKEQVEWYCMVRNLKKWPDGEVLLQKKKVDGQMVKLYAKLLERGGQQNHVRFSWRPKDLSFNRILEIFGEVPLPPYIERDPGAADEEAYQTVFANRSGAVAAPTAGLHFTEELMEALTDRGVDPARRGRHLSACADGAGDQASHARGAAADPAREPPSSAAAAGQPGDSSWHYGSAGSGEPLLVRGKAFNAGRRPGVFHSQAAAV